MVVVISSMALTPVAVELALKIAGPTLDLSNCEDTPTDQMLTTIDEADGFGLFEDFFGGEDERLGLVQDGWVKPDRELSDGLRNKGGAPLGGGGKW